MTDTPGKEIGQLEVARLQEQESLAQRYPGRVVRYQRYGVWDYYEEQNPDGDRFAILSTLKSSYSQFVECAPYVTRMVQDVIRIPGCTLQLGIYGVTELGLGLIPALSLWYQSQLVDLMETALITGSVDSQRLLYVCTSRIGCTILSMVLRSIQSGAQRRLSGRIRRCFALQSFQAQARLDLPTFSSTTVRMQLRTLANDFHGRTAIWQMVQSLTGIASRCTQLGAQTFVLFNALKGHQGGTILTMTTLVSELLPFMPHIQMFTAKSLAWAVTTRDNAYLKLQGWKAVVAQASHRKEFVAGNMEDYAVSEFRYASEEVGDNDQNWSEIRRGRKGTAVTEYIREFGTHLPQIAFTVTALMNPRSLSGSLASLNLVQATTRGFASSVFDIIGRSQNMRNQLTALRNVYEVGNIPNIVPDGTLPFPVDSTTDKTESGISVEFRNVTFKYPDAKKYALRDVSFTLFPGQLCVIVGTNGAGKSTILKLIVRLYDPAEGQILIGGHDIRTLKLKDLRRAVCVLFQDYTHFPLSVRDNIALGDLSGCSDDEHIHLAARLAGAESFIETLPQGLDTYLKRPAVDQYTGPLEGSKTPSGNTFDLCLVRDAAGIRTSTTFELSGGQMQRLAVARTFMRSVARNDCDLGLLLFDEPSASLDPAAEHNLFDRLRELKGSKTMIFSTHRFGNLTRHADLILYMNESGIGESGGHEDLIRGEGEYARLWKLQAQAFV